MPSLGAAVSKQSFIGFYKSLKSMAQWANSSEKIGRQLLNYGLVSDENTNSIEFESIRGRARSL